MLAFSVVSLFLLSLLYSLQCFVLDYFLISTLSPACWAFVALDGLLLLYILSSYNIDYAASKGGVQWLLYSWLTLAKVILFFWKIFGKKDLTTGLVGAIGIYVVLFFVPAVYLILSARASRQLNGPLAISSVTVESMLHADMVLHVVVDLIDLATAFKYCDLPSSVRNASSWVVTYAGVILGLGLFMHGYSFPTAEQQQQQQQQDTGDIYLTRKHAALVGLLIVDLPLLVLRTFLWVNYPRSPGFSPFLVKNVIFLPIQIFRINQCRLAEREKAKSAQKAAFHHLQQQRQASNGSPSAEMRNTPGSNTARNAAAATAAGPSSSPVASPVEGEVRRRKAALSGCDSANGGGAAAGASFFMRPSHDNAGGGGGVAAGNPGLPVSAPAEQLASSSPTPKAPGGTGQVGAGGRSKGNRTSAAEGAGHHYAQHLPLPMEAAKSDKVQNMMKELRSLREVPVRGFSFWKLLTKVFHCFRVGGRHGLGTVLDDGFVLGYWKQMRLAVPLVLICLSEVATVVVANRQHVNPVPIRILNGWPSWTAVPLDLKVMAVLCPALWLLLILSWLGTAPFLDCVFVSLLCAVRLAAFYLVCSVARDTACLELQDKWRLPIATAPILLWFFALVPALRLLDALFPIQSAMLGRKFMYFVVPAPNRAMEEALLATISTFSSSDRNLLTRSRVRCDEFGWVTTSSTLVFLNSRHAVAPISFNELLIGPDVIKAVRLMDMLVVRSWLELVMVAALYLLTLFIHFDFLLVAIFSARVVMSAAYNIFSQAVRLLALRRYEVKIIFEEIAATWAAFDDHSDDAARRSLKKRKRFLSLLDICERYERQGFFTSPGDLFPCFL